MFLQNLRWGALRAACLLCVFVPGTATLTPAQAVEKDGEVARRASPAQIYGELYRAVELTRVFPDSKTFADMIARRPSAQIMADYRKERPQTRAELSAFVARNFAPVDQADVNQVGNDKVGINRGRARVSMRTHIRALWPILTKPAIAVEPGSSRLPLKHTYVVAGGRFGEMYYWDSYFTMLGLKADGKDALVEAMLANFVDLVARYGHVPNGTRSYYLTRSQPPFLALMMDLSNADDGAVARRRLGALRSEYGYWMAGADCLGARGACKHVVRMPDGALLNRYWDARDTPRDESYYEDVETARAAAPRPAREVYRNLRAGAESGWDFSSRWLRDGRTLATIETTRIVPIDLNSLLWNLENAIARRCQELADKACHDDFQTRATHRKAAIMRYLWSRDEQRFVDWNRDRQAPSQSLSAAMLYPLFVGLASPDQAEATAKLVEARLLAPGGLRTTSVTTGQQWDEPNGWAPLVWIAVHGLDRYGRSDLADRIAGRWIATVSTFYACTGRMVEKYDVDQGLAGGGGEYPVQDGFGWTNGVSRVLLDRPGTKDALVARCPSRARVAAPDGQR